MAAMEERMAAIESRVKDLVTQQEFANRISDIHKLVDSIGNIHKLMDSVNLLTKSIHKEKDNQGTEGGMRTKEAASNQPGMWSAAKSDVPFNEFTHSVFNWASALTDDGCSILESVEKHNSTDIGELELLYEGATKMNRLMYHMLIKATSGEPRGYVQNAGNGNGFKAWKVLVQWYDPRRGADKSAALWAIMHPNRAKDTEQATRYMQEWETTLIQYESKYGCLGDDVKICAVKEITPQTFLEGRIRGTQFEKYTDIKKTIDCYLSDKQVNAMGNMIPKKATGEIAELMAELIDKHKETDYDAEKKSDAVQENKVEQLLAALQWKASGGGKGMTKGNNGAQYGSGKGYGNQPQYQYGGKSYGKGWGQDQSKGGKGKTQWQEADNMQKGYGSGTKSGAKGKGRSNSGQCYNCGGNGHIARQCPSAPKRNIFGMNDEWHEEDDTYEDEQPSSLALLTEDDGAWRAAKRKKTKRQGLQHPPGLHERRMQGGLKNRWQALERDEDQELVFEDAQEMNKHQEADEEINPIILEEDELCAISEQRNGWMKITATVDSGAADSVMPPQLLPHIAIKSSAGSRSKKNYMSAGGERIPNLGEKVVAFVTAERQSKQVVFQIAKVTKPLISVGKIVAAGNSVNLERRNPCIIDGTTGEVTKLREQGGVFVLDMWVKVEQVFRRQGA